MKPIRTNGIWRLALGLFFFGMQAYAGPTHAPIDVTEYVDKVVEGDWTEAIRAAIVEAGKTRAWSIYFPKGSYTVSDTIQMNATPVTDGATITMTDPEKDIFYADNVWRRTMENFSFRGGHDQIAIGNKNVDQGFLVIRNCSFKNASGAAIRFLGGPGHEHKATASTYCLVESCHFSDCIQALVSVSDQATFRDAWISTSNKNSENLAVIENYGWLKCENILGVPRVSATDQRWIDNHGWGLVCNYFRFGGEGAGFTPVVNYAEYGSIKIENSCVFAWGNNKRPCAVYLEAIPSSVVIRDTIRNVPAIKINPDIDLQAVLNKRQGQVIFDVGNDQDVCSGDLPQELVEAIKNREVKEVDFGDSQLSAKETRQRLEEIRKEAAQIPSDEGPHVMTYQIPKGETGHRQQLEGYVEINPDTHSYHVNDNLDSLSISCSEYLAITKAGDDVVILNRIEKGKYPHVRVEDIEVDLEKTPFLTWKFKDVGEKGGHIAVKVIDNETEEQIKLMEDYYSDQTGYFAYDLRKHFKDKQQLTIDIKLYLCGSRIVAASGENMGVFLNKGDWMLLDFMRLEPGENE